MLRATCCATQTAASWDAALRGWLPAEREAAEPWPECPACGRDRKPGHAAGG